MSQPFSDVPAAPAQLHRTANGRFGPGNPGRPVGSRNRLSQRVAMSILRHYEKNEEMMLERLMETYGFPLYVRLLSGLLPRQIELTEPDLEGLDEAEARERLRIAKDAIARIEAGEATLLTLQAVLSAEVEPAPTAAANDAAAAG